MPAVCAGVGGGSPKIVAGAPTAVPVAEEEEEEAFFEEAFDESFGASASAALAAATTFARRPRPTAGCLARRRHGARAGAGARDDAIIASDGVRARAGGVGRGCEICSLIILSADENSDCAATDRHASIRRPLSSTSKM
tara:strand:- start:1847 stop:2263 length:417 start_codon:yes stop_codon:yes gene_type:complete